MRLTHEFCDLNGSNIFNTKQFGLAGFNIPFLIVLVIIGLIIIILIKLFLVLIPAIIVAAIVYFLQVEIYSGQALLS